MAIYLPSENDYKDLTPVGPAAVHRRDAIGEDPPKMVQTYRPRAEAPYPVEWYNPFFPCKNRPATDGCDEYPNRAMEGSGPPSQYDADGNLQSVSNTSLDAMPIASNSLEGRRYQSFTQKCSWLVRDLRSPLTDERIPFLVVPMTGDEAPPTSYAVCPGGSGEL